MIPRRLISARRASRQALAALLVPAGVLWASGGVRIEKTIQTTSNPRISIANLKGTILVRSWDRPEVHVVSVTDSPRVEIDSDQMPAGGQATKVHFATHVLDPQLPAQEEGAGYRLDIPVGSSLEIHNPEGSVTIERLGADEDVESVNGSISVRDSSGHVSVRSLNGPIEIIRPSGRVEAYTVMGSLRITDSSSPRVRAQTVSGSIVFDGDFVPEGEYVLSSYQGAMDIACPPEDSFELRARTMHGRVDNELQLTRKTHVPLSYGSGLFGVHNRGDATVQLTSYSGIIRLHPRL